MARRNLTIVVDDEVARWARLKAAESDASVSQLVGRMLKEQMRSERSYTAAKRSFLKSKPRLISKRDYPRRDEIHDRSRLR